MNITGSIHMAANVIVTVSEALEAVTTMTISLLTKNAKHAGLSESEGKWWRKRSRASKIAPMILSKKSNATWGILRANILMFLRVAFWRRRLFVSQLNTSAHERQEWYCTWCSCISLRNGWALSRKIWESPGCFVNHKQGEHCHPGFFPCKWQ